MESSAATLRLAVLPRAGVLTDALLIAGGAGLVSACAQITIYHDPVPFTGQTFAVVLVGASLGSIRGAASLLLYLLIGLAGAHVYADGRHGWAVLSGSTGGYLVGFVVAAALIGWLAERGWDRRVSTAVSAMLTGNVVIYVFGLSWLHHWLGTHNYSSSWSATFEAGLYQYVPGDLIKIYLAALALPTAWKLVERLKRDDS